MKARLEKWSFFQRERLFEGLTCKCFDSLAKQSWKKVLKMTQWKKLIQTNENKYNFKTGEEWKVGRKVAYKTPLIMLLYRNLIIHVTELKLDKTTSVPNSVLCLVDKGQMPQSGIWPLSVLFS